MPVYGAPVWKKAPFIRILPAIAAGIILQWYLQPPVTWLWFVLALTIVGNTSFLFLPSFKRYRFAWIQGVLLCTLLTVAGALLAWHKDARHEKNWFGKLYKDGDALITTITESPVEKTRSVKATATVSHILRDQQLIPVTGTIIIYFKKDSSIHTPAYGTQFIFKKPLQEIRSAGNPGVFDYKRYTLFNGITHQAYLQPGEFVIAIDKKESWLQKFIIRSRKWVLRVLRENITDAKSLGLAEALLIGYKDDLDKTLVQSYTNTGVVHVIAISGLHLGLIYWLLSLPFRSLKRKRTWKWLPPLIIISGLWLFSLLAGAQPSVLRSALMFTCIVIGESLSKRVSVFNSLALSAFILLCINPYWLWDAGFQLSYAAVLSIIVFYRAIYNWFYFRNKLIDLVWQLNAVTLAAQILTLPVCIYHFHQFPNYFLLANLVAVPLSSLILIGEIALCVFSFIPLIATGIGNAMAWCIRLMNAYIEIIEVLPWAVWEGLQVSVLQAVVLLLFITAIGYWLMKKSPAGLKWGLFFLACFTGLRSYSFMEAQQQQKIIVYNVPKKKAIDFMDGRHYYFAGDSALQADDAIRNFHLRPSRVMYRVQSGTLRSLWINSSCIQFRSKRILILDRAIGYAPAGIKQTIDILLVTGNPPVDINKLRRRFHFTQVVFDASVPAWKVRRWEQICDTLRIPTHDVTVKGAFVMNLR